MTAARLEILRQIITISRSAGLADSIDIGNAAKVNLPDTFCGGHYRSIFMSGDS